MFVVNKKKLITIIVYGFWLQRYKKNQYVGANNTLFFDKSSFFYVKHANIK